MGILVGSLLTTGKLFIDESSLILVSFCLSMLLAYKHRNDGASGEPIEMPSIIPGTQQAANYIRGSVRQE